MINVSIIGTVGVPACYGGFESLVENLLDFHDADINYNVFCSKKTYTDYPDSYKGAKLTYIDLKANGISSILYDIISIIKSLKSDVMVILGVSGCIFLPVITKIYKGKIITNIDGIEWKRQKWNWLVKKFLHFSEMAAVRYSDVVIGDNKGITDYIYDNYRKKAELIEYGADHAVFSYNENWEKEYAFIAEKYAITVCRIEPENNISIILEAFKNLDIGIRIVIVGNWSNSDYGKSLYNRYLENKNIILLNPVYKIEKINYLRSRASVYIHGHSAGGTNPSLVEAMNLGLPVVAYDCIYNRETTENAAVYWSNANQLYRIINEKENIFEIGKNMEKIANRRYKWEIISCKYLSIIKSI